ncbi:hypothetical protein [Actinomadura opuntiae]|uniref:hypothetical protein n=1 Tax=Actinomadura sp. OS1-43 TaxID=604315 RepID=UPI00255B25E8|nr:hypothetical protein [Actinomadura sp. OS1-43]MDL4819345.1 hypothetical protein [Actinomadura sp. OS1-43]
MDQPHAAGGGAPREDPDVLLDVPVVKVDEIELEVDDLRADVSLRAAVLDVLNLEVGADVTLGRVSLALKGVEAQAVLKVRLDNVARIIERVLETVDANPEILAEATRGLGTAAGELGRGAGGAVRDVGRGAGGAVREVGTGAARTVDGLGGGAGRAVQDVGGDAGRAVRAAGGKAGNVIGDEAGQAAGDGVVGPARHAADPGRPGPELPRRAPHRPHVGREPGPEHRRTEAPQPPPAGPAPRGEPRRDVPGRADDLAAGDLAAALTRKSVRAGRDLIGGVLKRLPGS